jgi:hypothetical protein
MYVAIPLSKRPLDILWIVFFVVNLTFITYIVDIEQIIIDDPSRFEYPPWPPAALVDLVHWWGRNYDPVLMARPAWWRATIWIDSLVFGPFYVAAIFAFLKGREWIRIPTIIWGSMMLTVVTIILFEEMVGEHATPERAAVLLANAPWALAPLFLIVRMARNPRPFTRAVEAERRAAS